MCDNRSRGSSPSTFGGGSRWTLSPERRQCGWDKAREKRMYFKKLQWILCSYYQNLPFFGNICILVFSCWNPSETFLVKLTTDCLHELIVHLAKICAPWSLINHFKYVVIYLMTTLYWDILESPASFHCKFVFSVMMWDPFHMGSSEKAQTPFNSKTCRLLPIKPMTRRYGSEGLGRVRILMTVSSSTLKRDVAISILRWLCRFSLQKIKFYGLFLNFSRIRNIWVVSLFGLGSMCVHFVC